MRAKESERAHIVPAPLSQGYRNFSGAWPAQKICAAGPQTRRAILTQLVAKANSIFAAACECEDRDRERKGRSSRGKIGGEKFRPTDSVVDEVRCRLALHRLAVRRHECEGGLRCWMT